jgi:aryl carrier-like protein
LKRQGFVALSPPAALAALDEAVLAASQTTGQTTGQTTSDVLSDGVVSEGVFSVMDVDWARMAELPERREDLRLSELLAKRRADGRPQPQPGAGGANGGSGDAWGSSTQDDRSKRESSIIERALEDGLAHLYQTGDQEPISEALTLLAADLLGFAPDRLERDKPLSQYGFDSLMVVSLRNQLSRALGRNVPVTLAFERPTILALADWLAENQKEVSPDQTLASRFSQGDGNGARGDHDREAQARGDYDKGNGEGGSDVRGDGSVGWAGPGLTQVQKAEPVLGEESSGDGFDPQTLLDDIDRLLKDV